MCSIHQTWHQTWHTRTALHWGTRRAADLRFQFLFSVPWHKAALIPARQGCLHVGAPVQGQPPAAARRYACASPASAAPRRNAMRYVYTARAPEHSLATAAAAGLPGLHAVELQLTGKHNNGAGESRACRLARAGPPGAPVTGWFCARARVQPVRRAGGARRRGGGARTRIPDARAGAAALRISAGGRRAPAAAAARCAAAHAVLAPSRIVTS